MIIGKRKIVIDLKDKNISKLIKKLHNHKFSKITGTDELTMERHKAPAKNMQSQCSRISTQPRSRRYNSWLCFIVYIYICNNKNKLNRTKL